jgi:hypothetical protein
VGDCCHFKVDRLKLANYTSSEKVLAANPVEVHFTYQVPRFLQLSEAIFDPFAIHNKHGGRYTITQNCQYLS